MGLCLLSDASCVIAMEWVLASLRAEIDASQGSGCTWDMGAFQLSAPGTQSDLSLNLKVYRN